MTHDPGLPGERAGGRVADGLTLCPLGGTNVGPETDTTGGMRRDDPPWPQGLTVLLFIVVAVDLVEGMSSPVLWGVLALCIAGRFYVIFRRPARSHLRSAAVCAGDRRPWADFHAFPAHLRDSASSPTVGTSYRCSAGWVTTPPQRAGADHNPGVGSSSPSSGIEKLLSRGATRGR